MRASAPPFTAVVKARAGRLAQGPSRALDGTVLLLDVLPHDAQRCPVDRPGEVGAGPQPLRAPVVVDEVGELLPQMEGRDALEAVDQPGRAILGGRSTSRYTWLASSLNSTSSASKSAQTARMISSNRRRCRWSNARCRYFVTDTECA